MRSWLLVATVLCGCRSPAPQARDAGGLRVVCLTPSSTEMVHAVGALASIVGVDEFSTVPPEVRSLPKVGDFLHPNLEATLALHPDIVVADAVQTKAIEALNSSGIKVLALPMQTLADVRAAFLEVGRALGREPEGRAAQGRFDEAISAAEARAAKARSDKGRAPKVLFVVDRRPGSLAGMVAAGPGSYLDDLIRRAGGENALAAAPLRYVQITAEEVLTLAPDVILDAAHVDDTKRAIADWDALSAVPAVAAKRVVILDDPSFVTPGPRLATAFPRLVSLLWD